MYVLDSNVFIQAHRSYYPFDVVPSFWSKLIALSNRNKILSIDKVKHELCDGQTQDSLALWCTNDIRSDFFVDTSPCVDKYAILATWVQSHQQFDQNAKDDFLSTDLADPWLISYALKNNFTIVTHETSQPQRKNRIKIPEPCIHFGVRYVTPIQMFRDLHETF